MPNWAQAPIIISFGLASSAEKSVIAPIPREDQWRIPASFHTIVQDVQNRTLFIDSDFHTRLKGDVAYEHAESYGNEQKWFEVLLIAR